MQGNRKVKSIRADDPDRDAPFLHIQRQRKRAIQSKNPVISVDTQKKEVMGGYKNGGKEWYRKGERPAVADDDVVPPDALRTYPYGIYELKANTGLVNVGTDRDTSSFAVASIWAWWKVERPIHKWNTFYFLMTGEVLTVPEEGSGNTSCMAYRKREGFRSRSASIRRVQARGTKENTDYFRS
jgi:hypothetical protein